MKKAAVIGGGLAGFSAAVHLSNSGIKTFLFEASPKAGGRAYSLKDQISGDIIDNGQHLMMGCYTSTLRFLDLIGGSGNIFIQRDLEVNFADRSGKISRLAAGSAPYPFSLLQSVLNYDQFSWKDKAAVISFFLKLPFTDIESLKEISVADWLGRSGQTVNAVKALWEILAVGALNCSIEKASASVFAHILKQMFLKGGNAAKLIIPATGLTQMYCNQAADFIRSGGGEVYLSSPLEKIYTEQGRVSCLEFRNGRKESFDFAVLAVPPHSLARLIPEEAGLNCNFSEMKYSSILSVHIWISENNFREKFYGLIDSEVHWVFNHGRFLTIVISNADKFSDYSAEDIYKLVTAELKIYFRHFSEAHIVRRRVIFEKRATVIPDSGFLSSRPAAGTGLTNLFLAGDWTDTGLPSTIESAVRSGEMAAIEIRKRL
ncbi:MAG: hydroxysqualene dehydroxylase HpnE [Syntrophothermus sp.]